jgi:hypothetical protein
MYKEVLQSIANIEVFPVISLIIFMIGFVSVTLGVMSMKRKDVARYSRLPLEDSAAECNEEPGRTK